MPNEILSGVLVGAAGGAVAGLILWIIGRLNDYEIEYRERRRVYKWLDNVTLPPQAKKWRSTRSISSFTDITEDRVRYLCSRHPKIKLSTGDKELWGIDGRARREDEDGIVH
ncbi:MAG: hypothetical protein AB1831_06085 [Pseudomonadota bacterium]